MARSSAIPKTAVVPQSAPRVRTKLTPEQRARVARVTKTQPQDRLVHQLTPEQLAMAADRSILAATIRKLTADKDAIDDVFKGLLSEAGAVGVDRKGNPVVVMAPWSRHGLDGDRLKAEQPEIAAEYEKISTGVTPKYMEGV